MATKKEIKEFLNENGLTEIQMDYLFNELADTNSLVKNLISNSIHWKNLNISAIKDIPTRKQKDLKNLEDNNLLTNEMKEKEKMKNNYEENFEEIMFCKILKKEKLSEYELIKLLDFEIDEIEGRINRWTQDIKSIIKICEQFFAIEWEKGLTEVQDDTFFNQPYEVEKHQYEKKIIVTEWNKI